MEGKSFDKKKFNGSKKPFDKPKKTYTREYKKEQISKNIQKKRILKKNYEKLLKSEGYNVDEADESSKKGPKISYKEQKLQNIAKLKEQKKERRAKKKEVAANKFKASKEFRDQQLERVEEIKLKNQQRKERQEKMNIKTRKGQPVMSFKIDDLLNKIKSQDH
ncbi:hypothetical protein QEN19_000456 [Hanseniaspora menglaensis]